jgi:hypothetical protein
LRELSRREMAARANYLAKIRETRQRFLRDFPDGCRVEFPPATPENPTIRTGRGTIIGTAVLEDGRKTRVYYTLDDFKPERVHDSAIQTFLGDNPVRIEDPC